MIALSALLSLVLSGVVLGAVSTKEKVDKQTAFVVTVFIVTCGVFSAMVDRYAFMTFVVFALLLTGYTVTFTKD